MATREPAQFRWIKVTAMGKGHRHADRLPVLPPRHSSAVQRPSFVATGLGREGVAANARCYRLSA